MGNSCPNKPQLTHLNQISSLEKGEQGRYCMYMHVIDRTSPLYCLNANLRKASRAILSMYMDEMRESGIQGTQFTLLSTISGFGKAKITDLANFMGMDQTTVTRNINVLKKDGYVVAIPGEDKRTRLVELTPKGEQVVQQTYPMWLEAQTKLWDQLGEEKAAAFLQMAQEIVEISENRIQT